MKTTYHFTYCMFFSFVLFQQGVHSSDIVTSASSVLGDKSYYSHKNCIDGNLHTAWVEGNATDGINEWIQLDFGKEKELSYIGVLPGYLKINSDGKDFWNANNQVATATLFFSDSTTKHINFKSITSSTSRDETGCIADKSIQYFKADKKTSFVKLIINNVIHGSEFNDACISEIIPVFDGKPKYTNDQNGILIQPIFHDRIPPLTITFSSGAGPICDEFLPKFSKLNDSVYYTGINELLVTPGAEFSLSSQQISVTEILQAEEYRWTFGKDPFHYFKEDSLGMVEGAFLTHWYELKRNGNNYEILDIQKPQSINNFAVKTQKQKSDFVRYFDSLKIALNIETFFQNYKTEDCMALLKISKHIKIKYIENGVNKSLLLLLYEWIGEC